MNKLKKLQAIANHELSNYDGTLDEFEQFSGGNLQLVDFDGGDTSGTDSAGAFPQEVQQVKAGRRRMVQFTVENANARDYDFYLSEGLNSGLIGTILSDNTALVPVNQQSAEVIKVRGLLKDIKYFRNFFRGNPTRVLGFKVSADTTSQIETNVNIEVHSPFHKALKSRQIVLADYQNENTFRDKVVTVPEQFQLDDITEVRMTIAANTKMTVTLYIGAVLSTSKGLHKMALASSRNLDYSSSMLKDKAAAYGLTLGI